VARGTVETDRRDEHTPNAAAQAKALLPSRCQTSRGPERAPGNPGRTSPAGLAHWQEPGARCHDGQMP
jgi:hypothetical protein